MAALDLEWEQFLNQPDNGGEPSAMALFPPPARTTITKASSANATSTWATGTNATSTRATGTNAISRSRSTKAISRSTNALDEEESSDEADECVHNNNHNEEEEDCVVSALTLTEETCPKCTPIYVSTKTKISYLSKPVDIHAAFWEIPVLKYAVPKEGTIKKQMKFSTTDPLELAAIQARLKKEAACVNEFVIEHIENPEGRIKFKDQRKISIGLCKKDIVSYRIKQKRAFFNCFVVILRITDEDDAHGNFKEMHVKVFNTGKLEIPGVKTDIMLHKVQTLLVQILKPILGDDLDFQRDQCETVLINSNFKCGYYINRDALYHMLKYKYRINCNYDACSYPGIQCKFFYVQGMQLGEQTGQQPVHFMGDETNKHKKARNDTKPHYEISFMIFRTGSVLIVGKCNEDVLHEIYDFIKTMLETEYMTIGKCLVSNDPLDKKRVPKVRRKVLIFSDGGPKP
jgi:TATA-box binding protein (TBP) (component of TFIID and TFIIIB)